MKNENNLLTWLIRAFSTSEILALEDLTEYEYGDVLMSCGIAAPDEIVEPAKNN